MINIIVHGFMGKMGQVILRLINEDEGLHIAAGIDPGASGEDKGFPTFKNLSDCDVHADVLIDFSTAQAVPALLDYVQERKIPLVLCTTGLDEETVRKSEEVSKDTAIFRSYNMSLGINLLASILEKYSNILKEAGFDIEIIEKHHNLKIDAPSGTAILLADAVNEGLSEKCEYVYERASKRERRSKNEIGLHSLRGGTIVGEHSVIFAGLDEVIELKHNAYSKEVFGTGAINAAKFMAGKTKGMYNMGDLIK